MRKLSNERPDSTTRTSELRHSWPGIASRAAVAAMMLAGIALVAMSACASQPDRPEAELARAEASIELAERAGAVEYGASELATAREKLANARAAAERGDRELAKRQAEEAAVDAELAAAISRNREAENAVKEINDSIDALREEIARGRNGSQEGV